jgi:predicted transcriptional regulator
MVVNLTPAQEAQLARIASRSGKVPEQVVQDAVALMIEPDAGFAEAVEKGFASLDRGEFVEHEDVGARIERLFL